MWDVLWGNEWCFSTYLDEIHRTRMVSGAEGNVCPEPKFWAPKNRQGIRCTLENRQNIRCPSDRHLHVVEGASISVWTGEKRNAAKAIQPDPPMSTYNESPREARETFVLTKMGARAKRAKIGYQFK